MAEAKRYGQEIPSVGIDQQCAGGCSDASETTDESAPVPTTVEHHLDDLGGKDAGKQGRHDQDATVRVGADDHQTGENGQPERG